MNTFFVKNREVAFSLDPQAKETVKTLYHCCPSCDEGYAEEVGFLVSTPLTRSELQKKGVMVSSPLGWGGRA